MSENWRHIFDHLPFVLASGNAAAGRVNPQRIIEALIIAVITAAATSYATTAVMTAKLDERTTAMSARQDRTDAHVDTVDGRLTAWQLSVMQQGRKGQ